MESGKKRRLMYVATAIVAAMIVLLAVLLLQQPIQKQTPPLSKTAPAVTTADATGVNETEATLNGNLGSLGTASAVSVGFRYGTSSDLAGAANATIGAQGVVTPFSRALGDLTADTTYYFEAWALGDGYSTGNVLHFTTLTEPSPQVHPPSVATKSASDVTTQAATLNGDLGDLGTATSVTVGFRYGTDATLAAATNVTVGGRSAVGAFEENVLGLTADTTYYVQAWGMGNGFANGSVVSFHTASSTPSGNGHHVPPGWAHAACPNVPQHAAAHGVHARCEQTETWGQWKKEHPGATLANPDPAANVTADDTAAPARTPGNSGGHRSTHSHVF